MYVRGTDLFIVPMSRERKRGEGRGGGGGLFTLLASFLDSWSAALFSICARTFASIWVGSCTASSPSTRIRFDILSLGSVHE